MELVSRSGAMMAEGSESITVARTLDEVEALRPAWQELSFDRVDADLDFYLSVIAARPHAVRPHVVVLRAGGGVEAMAVARVEDIPLTSSIGYRPVYRPTVRSITLVHGGVAGAGSARTAGALVSALRGALAQGEADVLLLPALRAGLPVHGAAATQPAGLLRERSGANVHWRLRLPSSLDEFLRTKPGKSRERIRRTAKRLRKDHGDGLSVEILREPADAERLFRDLDRVAAKTYQRGLGVSFGDTREHRALTTLGLERGWFRAYVLYLDGEPIAFWPGYAYGGTFFTGTPGYDPEFSRYRVGEYLQTEMIEDLCHDDTIEYVDYGFGDAEYKQRFGDESWEEADILLFAPTFKGARVRATRAGVDSSVRLAKRVLGGERSLRVKKAWRKRLESRDASR